MNNMIHNLNLCCKNLFNDLDSLITEYPGVAEAKYATHKDDSAG